MSQYSCKKNQKMAYYRKGEGLQRTEVKKDPSALVHGSLKVSKQV